MSITPSLCIAARPGPETLLHPEGTPPSCKPLRNEHLPTCPGAPCKGCLPRLAEPGQLACSTCRGDVIGNLGDLAQLHVDLLTPTRSGPGGRRPPGSEPPLALADPPREARQEIERVLTIWSEVIDEQVSPFPWGQQIREGRWIIAPPWAAARWLAPAWAPERTLATMAHRIARHADRLLADPEHAEQLVRDVAQAHAEAFRRAYPAAPSSKVIGTCPIGGPDGDPCGGTVRATVDTLDQSGWARCGTCKTECSIEWWQTLMPADQTEWLGMKALRWHLQIHAHRSISEHTIRSWARYHDEHEAVLPSLGDLATRRLVYNVAAARHLAETARGRGNPNFTRRSA